jgi:hypothetical protein
MCYNQTMNTGVLRRICDLSHFCGISHRDGGIIYGKKRKTSEKRSPGMASPSFDLAFI